MFEEYEWEFIQQETTWALAFLSFSPFHSFFHISVSFGYGRRRRFITLHERNEILLFPLLEADLYTMDHSYFTAIIFRFGR